MNKIQVRFQEVSITAILGIDAAWSEAKPSGVALIRQREEGGWAYIAAAPSCQSFIQLARGQDVNWLASPVGGQIQPEELLIAIADRWPDTEVTVIAVDMPVANQPVRGRRPCDDAISSAFGAAWAGTHSPRENLPGAVSDDLIGELERLDYWLATCVPDQVDYEVRDRATIEVYPHPAIVRLLNLEVRLKYKFDKSNRFWPGRSLAQRRERISANLRRLRTGLTTQIIGIREDCIPTDAYLQSRRALKRFEDTLDALVCAWVGACYFEGHAECYGDAAAAIWVPE